MTELRDEYQVMAARAQKLLQKLEEATEGRCSPFQSLLHGLTETGQQHLVQELQGCPVLAKDILLYKGGRQYPKIGK